MTTPHPTITAFLRWADLCVAISSPDNAVVQSVAVWAASYRAVGRTSPLTSQEVSDLARQYKVAYDHAGQGPRVYSGTLTSVLILDGEKSRAYIDAPKPLADAFVFSD
jgi:hypothetical protein